MTWLRKDDIGYDDPRVLAIGNAAYGAAVRMEQYASTHGTDGWIPDQKAAEIASKTELRALLRTYPDLGVVLHTRGDRCDCLQPHTWSPARGGYWLHEFLKLNPSRAEVDVHKAKKAELRNAKLKHSVRVRDSDTCRYCDKACSFTDRVSDDGLTYDHVDPELAAGMANLVVACRGCNNRKNRRTPAQAGMTLLPTVTDLATTRPVTVASLVVSPVASHVAGPVTGPDLSRVDLPSQVQTSPGRDGAGGGSRSPRISPLIRPLTPSAGVPSTEHAPVPGQLSIVDELE